QLTHQVLHQGHRGTMSEYLDAYQISTEKLVESGTYSQAWSVSEFARNAQQDYLGYRPQMLQQTLTLAPRFPNEWNEVSARVPFGSRHHLDIIWHRQGIDQHIEIIPSQSFPELKLHLNLLVTDNQHWHIETNLGGKFSIRYSKQQYDSHPKMQATLVTIPSWIPYPLTFCRPDWTLTHSALQEQNFLLNKRR
ncbi:glycogen debranching protein, partial [Vibrio paracholerae]|nr:glycogen debranching protein [Vibrio paracholerae]